MGPLIRKLGTCVFAVALVAVSQGGFAGPLVCADGSDGRYVTLTNIIGGVSCGPTALTPPVSPNNVNNFFNTSTDYAGYELLHKIEDGGGVEGSNQTLISAISGLGGNSGSISLEAGITDAVLVFKFGYAQVDPDWIGFIIDGMTSADWASGQNQFPGKSQNLQALSHVSLWGKITTEVPEPGTALLLATGIFGLVASRKRMKKTA